MHYFIIIVLAVAIGGWILYPFFTSHTQSPKTPVLKRTSPVRRQKKKRGQKSRQPPAHQARPQQPPNAQPQPITAQQMENSELFKELERIRRIEDLETTIEEEVKQIRKLPEFQRRMPSQQLLPLVIKFCPQCGTQIDPKTLWCQQCAIDLHHHLLQ